MLWLSRKFFRKKDIDQKRSNHWKNLLPQIKDAGNAQDAACRACIATIIRKQKARPLLLSLFDDNSIEVSSKVIILGSYNAELNQNKAKKYL